MSKYIAKYPVNWIDGMKVNKDHFIQEAEASIDQVRDAISTRTTPINFGLLPPDSPNDKPSLKYWVESSNQNSVSVKIMECQAITYGGIRVSITNKEQEPFQASVELPKELVQGEAHTKASLYLILNINPYKRFPFGELNPAEEPPRYPFTQPNVSLSVLNTADLASESSTYQLVIAKLNYYNGLVEPSADYIPPATTISSHPKLMEHHLRAVNHLLGLEYNSLQIIRKIISKKQTNQLAQIVKEICGNILHFLAANLSMIKEYSVYQPPLEMIARTAGLSRAIKNTIEQYHGMGKEELLNYLSDWLDMTQVDFEKLSTNLINVEYDHNDCQEAFTKCFIYLERMDTLFRKLSELDYIGKKDDTDIFVGLNRDTKHLTFWQRIVKRLFGL